MPKQEVIKNAYDGPLKKRISLTEKQFELDFCYSEDPTEVTDGIINAAKGLKVSILAMSIALFRVKNAFYFTELGFKNFNQYLFFLEDKTGIARTTFIGWVQTGEAYFKYRADLEKIGFEEADGVTKLRYLPDAIELHGKKSALARIKDSSLRDFYIWSKTPKDFQDIINSQPHYSVRGSKVYVNETELFTFAEGLPPDVKKRLIDVVTKVYEIIEKGSEPVIIETYDEGEKRQLTNSLKKIREKK